MKTLTVILQATWLILSVGPLLLAIFLRRVSLRLAGRKPETARYFKAQGQAWEGTAVEIATAMIRGCAGFFLPEHPIVALLLAVGVTGRLFQIIRFYPAYNSIVNGEVRRI